MRAGLPLLLLCLWLCSCGPRRSLAKPDGPSAGSPHAGVSPPGHANDTIYPFIHAVQVPPSFPGGDDSLYSYLSRAIHYPAAAVADSISGRNVVGFIIEKDGRIANVHLVRSLHPLLDAESIRVISAMPPWTPGLMDSVPVRVAHQIPIRFTMR